MFKKISILFVFTLFAVAYSPLHAGAEEVVELPHPVPKYLIHEVKKGDTLHDLAGYYLSSPRKWPEIYELNKEKIKNRERLEPGTQLLIPDLPEPLPFPTFDEYRKNVGTYPSTTSTPSKGKK